jgi:hypothetical protein
LKGPTYSLPRGFAKQVKLKSESLSLESAKVTFSPNANKAKFVFICRNTGDSGSGYEWVVF